MPTRSQSPTMLQQIGSGDRFVRIGGVDVEGAPMHQVSAAMKSAAGKGDVEITFRRASGELYTIFARPHQAEAMVPGMGFMFVCVGVCACWFLSRKIFSCFTTALHHCVYGKCSVLYAPQHSMIVIAVCMCAADILYACTHAHTCYFPPFTCLQMEARSCLGSCHSLCVRGSWMILQLSGGYGKDETPAQGFKPGTSSDKMPSNQWSSK
jgi:hypothetical protein